MNLTAAGVDLNGSMQMMLSAVFSALSERAKTEKNTALSYAWILRAHSSRVPTAGGHAHVVL